MSDFFVFLHFLVESYMFLGLIPRRKGNMIDNEYTQKKRCEKTRPVGKKAIFRIFYMK